MEKSRGLFNAAVRRKGYRRRPLPPEWRRQKSSHAGAQETAPTLRFSWRIDPPMCVRRLVLRGQPYAPPMFRIREFSSWHAGSSVDNAHPTHTVTWNDRVQELLAELQTPSLMEEKSNHLRRAHNLLEELVHIAWRRKSTVEGSLHEASFEFVDEEATPLPMDDTPVDARLALELLDSIVQLDQDSTEDTTLDSTILSSDALNVILQLWRTELVYHEATTSKRHSSSQSSLPTPNEMLAKLDDYRMSALLSPDVQSYNILLGAGASLGQVELCRQVYEWMWTESLVDNLVQPDRVTLRAMFQAIIHSSDDQSSHQASHECEQLVHEYLSRHQQTPGDGAQHLSARAQRDIGAIYQSLIHIWAVSDPWQARSYLQELAQRHLDHIDKVDLALQYPAPDTMTWNRVLSALSIHHGQPQAAMQLLNEFRSFSQQLHNRRRHEKKLAAEQSLILTNAHHSTNEQQHYPGIPQPDLFSYNSILEGWARLGDAAQANKVYEQIVQQSETKDAMSRHIQPNIVTFTSAIKANGGNLDRVLEISQHCVHAYQEQNLQHADDDSNATTSSSKIHLDHAFFHAWLKACVLASAEGDAAAAVTTAETVLLEIMPTVGIQPTRASFGFLLQCFVARDDLEGATQWLLKNVSRLDEPTIVKWTLELLGMGEIELVSFMDRFWGSSKTRRPKALLQVLIQDEHLRSSEALEHVLAKLPVEQGVEVLQWIPDVNRTPQCYASVLRSLAKEGKSEAAEAIWESFQEEALSKRNRMVDDDGSSSLFDDPGLIGDMYTSLIVAWSKHGQVDRSRLWWDAWLNDKSWMAKAPPTRVAQTSMLSCYAAAFQPNQAEAFLDELHTLHQEGHLLEPPDLVMYNVVLKAWVLAASGSRAQKLLDRMSRQYGVLPDKISYNSVVQAFVKERKMERATSFVRAQVEKNQPDDNHVVSRNVFPDLTTFRYIVGGWSLYRQDYQMAWKQSSALFEWMKDLHAQGILNEDPELDKRVMNAMAECKRRQRQSHWESKQHQNNNAPKQQREGKGS